jgi:hypothetical protein
MPRKTSSLSDSEKLTQRLLAGKSLRSLHDEITKNSRKHLSLNAMRFPLPSFFQIYSEIQSFVPGTYIHSLSGQDQPVLGAPLPKHKKMHVTSALVKRQTGEVSLAAAFVSPDNKSYQPYPAVELPIEPYLGNIATADMSQLFVIPAKVTRPKFKFIRGRAVVKGNGVGRALKVETGQNPDGSGNVSYAETKAIMIVTLFQGYGASSTNATSEATLFDVTAFNTHVGYSVPIDNGPMAVDAILPYDGETIVFAIRVVIDVICGGMSYPGKAEAAVCDLRFPDDDRLKVWSPENGKNPSPSPLQIIELQLAGTIF